MIKNQIIQALSYLKTSFICGCVILLALILRWSVGEVYMVTFTDMMPTLLIRDTILVNKLAYGLRLPFMSAYFIKWSKPSYGDVIIFKTPFDAKKLAIRRVIALPGDRVMIKNNTFYLNNQKTQQTPPLKKIKSVQLKDEYFSQGLTEDKSHYIHLEEHLSDHTTYRVLKKRVTKQVWDFKPYRIPKGYYFVMGDHRGKAQDSRTWPHTINRTTHNEPQTTHNKPQTTHNEPQTTHNKPQTQYGNLISETSILARVSYVLIGCHQTFASLAICKPTAYQWSRAFFSIYYQ